MADFEQPSLFERTGYPCWEDVYKGRAHLETVLEPCDQCASSPVSHFINGKCFHTAENYAFPLQQPNGMCRKHYLRWN